MLKPEYFCEFFVVLFEKLQGPECLVGVSTLVNLQHVVAHKQGRFVD